MSTMDVPTPASGAAAPGALDALLDIPMPVVVEIGRSRKTVQDLLQIAPGSVVELDRAVGDPVDLYVSDRRFAQGEIVVVGEHFGVRITRLIRDGEGEAAA